MREMKDIGGGNFELISGNIFSNIILGELDSVLGREEAFFYLCNEHGYDDTDAYEILDYYESL